MSNQESKEQKKIIDHLEGHNFHVIRNIAASRSGELDIIACEPPNGKFWAIEVKTGKGVVSKLQEVKVRKIIEKGGIAFVAFGYEEFVKKFNHYRKQSNE